MNVRARNAVALSHLDVMRPSNELDFAIEKEEVGGRVVSWTSLKITSDWIKTGKAIVMLQFGLRKTAELPNVRDKALNLVDRRH